MQRVLTEEERWRDLVGGFILSFGEIELFTYHIWPEYVQNKKAPHFFKPRTKALIEALEKDLDKNQETIEALEEQAGQVRAHGAPDSQRRSAFARGLPAAFGNMIENTRLTCDKRIRKPAAALAFALILALMIAMPVPARGQELQPTVIRAGVVIDGTGSSPMEDVVIVIRDGRIVEVRSSTQADAANPSAIDLIGFHVLPGLIDVHAHLTISHDPDFDYGELSAAASGILGVVHAKRTLMAGFTTVRDPGGPHYADVALRDAIAAGWVAGPRMFVSGPILTMTGGHGAVGNWAPPELALESAAATIADGPDEIRRAVRLHQKYGVDFIKVIATGGIFTDRSNPGAASYTREEIEAAVDEARKRGQRVAAHAHGLEGIRNAVLAGAHSIEHGSFLDAETAKLMVERGVFLVSDVYADEYSLTHGEALGLDPAHLVKARAVSGRFREAFKLAHAAGVKIAFGTDAGVFPHGENAKQFALYVSLGMSPMEALQTATRNAAELIGVSEDVGTIEVGKRADLIAVASNPLNDIRQLEAVLFVMKAGVVVKNDTRR